MLHTSHGRDEGQHKATDDIWSTFNLLRRCRHKFPAGRKGCMPDSDISIVKCELGDPADVRCPVK